MDARDAIAKWEGTGLITPELASRLRGTLDSDERAERSGMLIRLLVGVGAVLIGGGLMLFIGSHWDSQSPVRRIGLVVSVYALVLAAATLADRRRLLTTGRALWFLSSITVGVNVFLLGQVFNLPLNFWQGTLMWMLAALAMGWASPSTAHGWLVVALGVLTLGWVSVPDSQFFDQGAFLWDPAGIRPLLPLIGLALVAGSTLSDASPFEFLGRPAIDIGALMIAVPLTVSTFDPYLFAGVWDIDARWFHAWVAAGAAGVIAVAWARTRERLLGWSFLVLAVLAAVLLIQRGQGADVPASIEQFRSPSWLARPFAESALLFGLYTAVIFGLALATVVAGQRARIPALVNIGIATIAVLVMATYIGRIAGTLPTALAVLLGGVLLVSVAVFLERKRRDLLAESEPVAAPTAEVGR
jgi:uncharacterized membrane protein